MGKRESVDVRFAILALSVLALVTIGGQCRGSLAQSAIQVTCGDHPCTITEDTLVMNLRSDRRPAIRTTPMTAAEWTANFDACVQASGTPYILAGRHPGISAGVGCLIED